MKRAEREKTNTGVNDYWSGLHYGSGGLDPVRTLLRSLLECISELFSQSRSGGRMHWLSIPLVKHNPMEINCFKHKPFLALSLEIILLSIDWTGCHSSSWSKKWCWESNPGLKWLTRGISQSILSITQICSCLPLSSSPLSRWLASYSASETS